MNEPGGPRHILTLCTGNAVRSPMLALMLAALDPTERFWTLRSAGTHAAEGAAISARTLEAVVNLEAFDLSKLRSHRTHQITDGDVAWADLVLTAEADHVAYCRARFPSFAARVSQVGVFCRAAPIDRPFPAQVAAASSAPPDDTLDVADPAGREQEEYNRCANVLWDLAQTIAVFTGADGPM